jgi:hypothetical protein
VKVASCLVIGREKPFNERNRDVTPTDDIRPFRAAKPADCYSDAG